MTTSFAALLKQVSIFADLSNEVCDDLCELVVARHYEKDQMLFHRGDPGDELLIVASGSVKVFLSEREGEHVLATLGDGEILGEMSLLTGEPRSASAMALVDSRMLVIPKDTFDQYLSSNAAVMREIATAMARRQARTNGQILPLRPVTPANRGPRQQTLRIQINHEEVQEEVQEICALDFFEELEAKAQRLRQMHHS